MERKSIQLNIANDQYHVRSITILGKFELTGGELRSHSLGASVYVTKDK